MYKGVLFTVRAGNRGLVDQLNALVLEKHQNSGYRYNSARWLINLGDAIKFRNEPGDWERARKTYQQSLEMFTEMGAPGYIKVLEERLSEFGD